MWWWWEQCGERSHELWIKDFGADVKCCNLRSPYRLKPPGTKLFMEVKTCTFLHNLQQVSQLWLWWWTRVRQCRNCCSNCTKLHVKKDDLIDEVYWKFQMGGIISSVLTWFATPSSTRPLCTGIHTLVCTTVSCICGTSTAWLNHKCKECTGRYIPTLLMKQPQDTPSSSAKSEWGASRVGSWVIRW